MFKIPLFDLSSVFYTSCTKKEPYLFIGKTHKFKNCLNLMTLDDTGINLLCQTGQTDNTARLSDPDLDALLDTALHTTDQAASTAAYKEVYEKVSALCPYVAINGLSYYDLYNKKIKNLDTASLYDFVKALDKATIE